MKITVRYRTKLNSKLSIPFDHEFNQPMGLRRIQTKELEHSEKHSKIIKEMQHTEWASNIMRPETKIHLESVLIQFHSIKPKKEHILILLEFDEVNVFSTKGVVTGIAQAFRRRETRRIACHIAAVYSAIYVNKLRLA